MHCIDDRRCDWLCHVTNAETDNIFIRVRLAECTYFFCNRAANIRNMIRIAGGEDSQGKIYKMLSFAGYEHTHRLSEAGDVADPWYTGDFEATYRDVKNGCEGLLAYIKEKHEFTL